MLYKHIYTYICLPNFSIKPSLMVENFQIPGHAQYAF